MLVLIPFFSKAQKEYKASNGITYHVGDTLRLGLGSKTDGSFLYVEDKGPLGGLGPFGNIGPGRNQPARSLPKDFANVGAVIKSIRKTSANGVQKYAFSINPGGPMRYTVYIDDAIAACEVKPCKSDASATATTVGSVADEIKKLKALLDSGAITKSEYDSQKKKLLGE